MIKAYVTGIPSLYEGEDIEIRFAIFEEDTLLTKETLVIRYQKPALVGPIALQSLLKNLMRFRDQEMTIIVNDGALCEFIRGTGKTKDQEVQRRVREIQNELAQFGQVTIKDAGSDFKMLEKWNEVLRA